MRGKIAGHFNMTYEDMLALGRGILSRGDAEISERNKGGKQKIAAQNSNSQADTRLIDFKSPEKIQGNSVGFFGKKHESNRDP